LSGVPSCGSEGEEEEGEEEEGEEEEVEEECMKRDRLHAWITSFACGGSGLGSRGGAEGPTWKMKYKPFDLQAIDASKSMLVEGMSLVIILVRVERTSAPS
jgi:hypothetical protein